MPRDKIARQARVARHARVRRSLEGLPERPRLTVFRSNSQIYAQVIDDTAGRTLESACSLDTKTQDGSQRKSKTDQSRLVGEEIAKRALQRGITKVVFDRGGYKYHGRVKALAEGAREGGLSF